MTTLAEELRQTLGTKDRAVFNALSREIAQAFNQNFTSKEVWAHLKKKGALKCSYRTFCRYVAASGKSVLTPDRREGGFPPGDAREVEVRPPVASPAPARSGDNGTSIGGFTFERLDAKDLI